MRVIRLPSPEYLARRALPLVLPAAGALALLAIGVLILLPTPTTLGAYLLLGALLTSIGVTAVLYRRGRVKASATLIAYVAAVFPLLSSLVLGLERNPLIYLSALGVALAGLLAGPQTLRAVARDSLTLVVGLVVASLVIGPDKGIGASGERIATGLTLATLLLGVAVMGWVSVHQRRGLIAWRIRTASRSRRREAALQRTRADLEAALRERDRLHDRLYQQRLELEAARAAAEAAARAKASFIATMSHELRTPLNIIIGFSTAMIEHPEIYETPTLAPPIVADLAEIRRNGQHLLRLINEVLDLAQVEAGRLELHLAPLPLVPVLDAMFQAARGLVQNRPVQLRREYSGALPMVVADEVRVRQVLLNLLSNACKFTHTGEVALGACASSVEVTIWVRDTGIGIAPADQERIFNYFERVDRDDSRLYTGTGLGLAISRWLVELHGGRIWLESELGKGSTFYFTLPRTPAPGVAVAPLSAGVAQREGD
ncbi:MAG: HAMP domain-containing histidine kinase [Chloroflexaceae bacterium]|nr:HAMP domain-containing histidine kinase [Chloroflexaceae bacterium]